MPFRTGKRIAPNSDGTFLQLNHKRFDLKMHEAGFSLERIGDYVGHSSTFMTDRYRHLLEGHEQEAADILDAYLAKRTGARTGAQPLVAVPQAASVSGI